MEKNKNVTAAVKIVLTLIIGTVGFPIGGYLVSEVGPIGHVVLLATVGALVAIWAYKPK